MKVNTQFTSYQEMYSNQIKMFSKGEGMGGEEGGEAGLYVK